MLLAKYLCLVPFIAWGVGACLGTADDVNVKMIRLKARNSNNEPPVITALAVDPRGDFLATAGDDHLIRILRQDDMSEVKVLDEHTDWVRSLAFRDDGKLLGSAANDGQLILWNRDAKWKIQQAMSGGPALCRVRFAPGGSIIGAVGFDPQLFLIGPGATRRPTLRCGCNDMRGIAFSDDGQLVVAAGRSGDIHSFHPLTGEFKGAFKLHHNRVRDLIFVPSSHHLISVGDDGRVIVFDTDAEEVIQQIRIPGCKLLAVAMLSDQRIAVGGADNNIRLIDTERGRIIGLLSGHSGSVCVLASNDQYLFSGSYDTTVRRWSIPAILDIERIAEYSDGFREQATN